jgi:hypothetical protein
MSARGPPSLPALLFFARITSREVLSHEQDNLCALVGRGGRWARCRNVRADGDGVCPSNAAPVHILDADDPRQVAHVDADGNLQVEGTVATTNVDDPGRMSFLFTQQFNFHDGMSTIGTDPLIPAGMRLVITHVSGSFNLPTGQTPFQIRLLAYNTITGGSFINFFVPTLTGVQSPGHDFFAFSQDTTIFADGPSFRIDVSRSEVVEAGDADVSVTGYFIACSAAPCS